MQGVIFPQDVYYSQSNGLPKVYLGMPVDGRQAKTIIAQAVVNTISANGLFSLTVESSDDGVHFEDEQNLLVDKTGTAMGFSTNDTAAWLRFKLTVEASTGGGLESVTLEGLWAGKPF